MVYFDLTDIFEKNTHLLYACMFACIPVILNVNLRYSMYTCMCVCLYFYYIECQFGLFNQCTGCMCVSLCLYSCCIRMSLKAIQVVCVCVCVCVCVPVFRNMNYVLCEPIHAQVVCVHVCAYMRKLTLLPYTNCTMPSMVFQPLTVMWKLVMRLCTNCTTFFLAQHFFGVSNSKSMP